MKLQYIKLNNFKSFGKIDINFENLTESVLITGDNRDTIGADSNEAGKSSLLDSIPWVLLGEVPQKVLSDSVIRRNTSVCDGRLGLEDDKHHYEIYRKRTLSGGSKLEFFIDGNDETLRRTSDTQQLILSTFGLPAKVSIAFTDFFNCVYFSPGVVDAFASHSMTSSKRLDLISRFLKLGKIDSAVVRVKEALANHYEEIQKIESGIEFLEERIEEADKKELLKFSKDLKIQLDNSIVKKKEFEKGKELFELRNRKDVRVASSESIRDNLRERVIELKNKIKQFDIDKNNYELNVVKVEELKEKKVIEDEFITKMSKVESDLMSVADKILDLSERNCKADCSCPACGVDLFIAEDLTATIFDSSSSKTLEEEIRRLKIKERLLSGRKHKLEKLVNGRVIFEEYEEACIDLRILKQSIEDDVLIESQMEFKKVNSQGRQEKEKLEKELLQFKKQEENLEVSLKVEVLHFNELLVYLDAEEAKISEFNIDIGRIENQLKILKENEEKLLSYKNNIKLKEKKNRRYLIWKDVFPKIKRIMINSFLPRFEDETNKYLRLLEAGVEVSFDIDFSKVNNEFSISILEGCEEWMFDERSRGMQTRVALCIGLALGELAKFDRDTTFDFRLFDEVLDSLDTIGIECFLKMIEYFPGQKFFISHDSGLKNKFKVNSTIRVIKQNGVSTVEV